MKGWIFVFLTYAALLVALDQVLRPLGVNLFALVMQAVGLWAS